MLGVDDTSPAASTVTDEPLPPDAPPPIGPRRLHRSTRDRMWQGVCGGVAEYLGVDATVVRIGFVLLSILGGVGIVAYGAAWLLVPEEGSATPTKRSPWQVAGIVVLGLVLAGGFDGWDGGIGFPLALVVIGAVLVWGNREPVESSAPPAAGTGGSAVVVEQGPGRWSWAPADDATTVLPSEAAPVPRRVDGRAVGRSIAVGIGGLLLAVGAISGAIAASDEIEPTTFLGVTLAGFGLLMAAGSFWGWSRPLAWGALTVVVALAAAAVIDVPLRGGVGERVIAPTAIAELPTVEHLAMGNLTLDLTALELTGDERHLEATVAVGELTVVVPEGVTVEVHAESGAGQIDLFERTDDGVSVQMDGTFPPNGSAGTGIGRIELDLAVGVGHVEVRRG